MTEDERSKIERMLDAAKKNRLPQLLLACDRIRVAAARGDGRVDASALVRLEELAIAAEQEWRLAAESARTPRHGHGTYRC